jgi:hypothetical protein
MCAKGLMMSSLLFFIGVEKVVVPIKGTTTFFCINNEEEAGVVPCFFHFVSIGEVEFFEFASIGELEEYF